MLLALVLAFDSSNLFAQIDNQKKPVQRTQNPTGRTGEPIVNQPSPYPGVGSVFSLGDSNLGLFASPTMLDSVIWGTGSICALSTAKNSLSGNGIWSSGPAILVFGMQGPWVFGALVSNQCLPAESNDGNPFSTLIQPFINCNLAGGWYVNMVPNVGGEMCYGKHLIVPVGPCIGKVICFGQLPVNLQLGAYYNSEKTEDGPSWQLRLQLQFQWP